MNEFTQRDSMSSMGGIDGLTLQLTSHICNEKQMFKGKYPRKKSFLELFY